METKNIISRRNFLTNTAAVASSFFIVPRHVLGKGFVAPSDKLNIAAVGCGGKADVNISLAFNKGSDNIVALCDVDDRQSKKFRTQFPNAPYYKDFRKLLEKEAKNIDAVIVSTPNHTRLYDGLGLAITVTATALIPHLCYKFLTFS